MSVCCGRMCNTNPDDQTCLTRLDARKKSVTYAAYRMTSSGPRMVSFGDSDKVKREIEEDIRCLAG